MSRTMTTQAVPSGTELQNKIVNRVELASILGVGERSIQNWEKQSLIPVIRLGRRRIYRLDAVLTALERLES